MRGAEASLAWILALSALAFPARADDERPPLQVAVDPGQELAPFPPRPPPRLVAAPPSPPPSPAPPQRTGDGAGPRLSFGRAFIPGSRDGFYGRFETEYWEVRGRRLMSITLGAEGWGTERGGGGALESTLSLGLRQPLMRAGRAPCLVFTAGPGWSWLLIDRVYGHTGVGLLAPFLDAKLGVDFRGVRLLADARAQYRWEWGADDYAHYHLGLTINLNSELWDGPAGNTR